MNTVYVSEPINGGLTNLYRFTVVKRGNNFITELFLKDKKSDLWIVCYESSIHITNSLDEAIFIGNIELESKKKPLPSINAQINVNNLSNTVKAKKLLELLGWFPNRKTQIIPIKNYYLKHKINLHQKAENFLEEFQYLKDECYLLDEKDEYNYTINLIGHDCNYQLEDFLDDQSFLEIVDYAKENVVCLGEIGSYYPYILAIGESGTLYYNNCNFINGVQCANNIIEVIEKSYYKDWTKINCIRIYN